MFGLGLSFNYSGLDLDRKISQSAHLWLVAIIALNVTAHCCETLAQILPCCGQCSHF